MLCNACGTRYRRTNSLGPSTPAGNRPGVAAHAAHAASKKRTPPGSPEEKDSDAVVDHARRAKKIRCANDDAHEGPAHAYGRRYAPSVRA